jgi:MoxR-like ATPase
MTLNPFADAQMAMLGSQMAQTWQKTLEAWWQALLADPGRISELVERLGRATPRPATGPSPAATSDLAAMLQAIELLDGRVRALEDQVRALGQSLETFVRVMEAATAGSTGGAP